MSEQKTFPRPPKPVFIAVLLTSLSFTLGFISWTITAHWHQPAVPIIFLVFLGLIFLLIRGIYRGRNWARWLFTAPVLLGLLNTANAMSSFELPIEKARYILQSICSVAAIILLFLPKSNSWFSSSRVDR